jgi:S-adenosylmethionine:tRNA ribosyltransferase-isomerase
MQDAKNIKSIDYTYTLPQDKIALYPLHKRDESKLLIYKNGNTSSDIFKNISDHIPRNSILILNNTKVVNARLYFHKPTGARIEIFCLEPATGLSSLESAFAAQGESTWKCLIGKAGKWKSGTLEKNFYCENIPYKLEARVTGKEKHYFLITFSWQPADLPFSEILKACGVTPLPPYIKREAEDSDVQTYQTLYAEQDGSVAAPTSGFHFTDDVLNALKSKNVDLRYLTLHIGAGTFKPVTTETLREHYMHSEKIIFSKEFITALYFNLKDIGSENYKTLISGGTTSTRAIESLYWFAVQVLSDFNEEYLTHGFSLTQWFPYEFQLKNMNAHEPLEFILEKMEKLGLEEIKGETSLIIVPGYDYKITDALITNFHLPGSTLLLLVAALVGDDWKKIYDYALANNFRFLSYGDSSLLFKNKSL